MKAMKRWIPLLLIGLLALGSMAGCTRKKPEASMTPTQAPTVAPASLAPENNPVSEETPGPIDGQSDPNASPAGSMDPAASPVGSMDPSASPIGSIDPSASPISTDNP